MITLAIIILTLSVFQAICCTELNISSNVVTDYLFKIIKILHQCEGEFLLVTSPESSWFPFNATDSEVSYLDTNDFLIHGLQSLGSYERTYPRCILVSPVPSKSSAITDLIQKMNMDLNGPKAKLRQPIIILIWPEVLPFNKTPTTELQILQSVFRNTTFRIDSDIYTIFITKRNPMNTDIRNNAHPYLKATIWEAYKIKNAQVLQDLRTLPAGKRFRNYNVWDDGGHFDELTSKAERRSDFMGEVIVASSRNESYYGDWISLTVKGDKITLLGGFSVYIYWDLMTMLNFSEGLVMGDGIATLPNNSLTGLTMFQINSGAADISLSQSLIVPFRADKLTFLQPTYFGMIHVFFQQPPASAIRNIVTAPFQTSLWLTIIATWLFLITAVKIGSYLKKFCNRFESTDSELSNEIGMWAIAAICQKSWSISPNSTAMKMVCIIGLFCGVLTYVAYSAAIVSTLAVNIVPVERLIDLVTFRFVFTVHKSSDPFQIFLSRMIKSLHLHQEVVRVTTENEISHLMDPLTPRAFLTYPDLFYQTALQLNYTEMYVCDHISKVRVSDVPYRSGMFVKKGSELTEVINHKLIILKERGYNFRYMQEYERKNVFSCVDNVSDQRRVDPVRFSDVFTAFLVVFIGLVLASFAILLEIIVFKIRQSNRSNRGILNYIGSMRP